MEKSHKHDPRYKTELYWSDPHYLFLITCPYFLLFLITVILITVFSNGNLKKINTGWKCWRIHVTIHNNVYWQFNAVIRLALQNIKIFYKNILQYFSPFAVSNMMSLYTVCPKKFLTDHINKKLKNWNENCNLYLFEIIPAWLNTLFTMQQSEQ